MFTMHESDSNPQSYVPVSPPYIPPCDPSNSPCKSGEYIARYYTELGCIPDYQLVSVPLTPPRSASRLPTPQGLPALPGSASRSPTPQGPPPQPPRPSTSQGSVGNSNCNCVASYDCSKYFLLLVN